MEAIDFLKNKGITKATCYTDGGTYYVGELAKLIEEYAALRQPLVSGRSELLLDFLTWFGRTYSPEELKVIGMQQLINEYEKSKQ